MAKRRAGGSSRPDRRYKDPDHAPPVVSEKRMTFFLSDKNFRELRLQTGYFQVANLENEEIDDPAPESPSALVREAVDFWLDQFRPENDRIRSPKEWEKRLQALREAMKKKGK